jgi:hypothetical protein
MSESSSNASTIFAPFFAQPKGSSSGLILACFARKVGSELIFGVSPLITGFLVVDFANRAVD